MKNAGYNILMSEIYEQYVSPDKEKITLYGVCIGHNGKGYVTWEFTVNEKGEYSYFWGHYFGDTKNIAFADYHKRLIKIYERRCEQ